MSVLIRGMKMPETAGYCSRKIDPDTRRCIYTGKEFEKTLSLLLYRRCADCPLIEVPEEFGDLIDKEKLYERTAELESQALNQVQKLMHRDDEEGKAEWRRWSAILNERTVFKHDVADAPVIIEGDNQ